MSANKFGLTKEQIAWILIQYWNCDIRNKKSGLSVRQNEVLLMALIQNEFERTLWELLLIPIAEMSDEDILEVCAAADPDLFGDYRFDKWEVTDRYNNGDTYFKVERKGEEEYFTVNKHTGEVNTWGEKSLLHDVEPIYTQVYFKKGIAIPLYIDRKHKFNGKTAIELELALDKTKQIK